jgi:ferrochelatase
MTASHQYNAVLLLAFGGPGDNNEIRPFLERVLAGRPVPPERIEEVAHHYEALGGRSPLPDITRLQAHALADVLKQLGLEVPVYVGFRHSIPYIAESLATMAAEGVARALGFILSSHHTEASWERYQKTVADSRASLGDAPAVDYCPGWHDHPLFIETWVDQIEDELEKIPPERRRNAALIFTAHSIPTAMAAHSPYVAELEASCRLVAEGLGHASWSLAYQSRSGDPREPWLEPDIGPALREAARAGVKDVIVAPIGFVADHVEVLYDLDIEAKAIAKETGMEFYRAVAPNDHPLFIRMIADVVEKQLIAISDQRSA